MNTLTPSPVSTRPPRQARTRAGWARVLEVGLDLLESGGWEALTVSEVCRQAGISPPSLYARVDGRAGLFAAVYEHGMASVIATEDRQLGADTISVRDVVSAVTTVFDTHRAFLRAVIVAAASDPSLLARGSQESRRFVDRIAISLPTSDVDRARTAARALYETVTFRTMYGSTFWESPEEVREAFLDRAEQLVGRLLISEKMAAKVAAQ